MSTLASTEGGRSDAVIIVLVAAAHYASHMLQLALPPLFPVLNKEFGASFTELGLFVTFFYIASGVGQTVAGVLVDRYGAHRLLVGGLTLLAASIAATGLASHYWMLLPLAIVAGLGNCVFHPADLSILSHRIGERRLGRAYAAHGLMGSLGYASAPIIVTAVAALSGWRTALVAAGAIGLAIAVALQIGRPLLLYDKHLGAQRGARTGSSRVSYLAMITAPVVVLGFVFFALSSFAGVGTQTFVVSALNQGYGLLLETATLALTAYLVGNSGGMILGGFVADHTERHHYVAFAGVLTAAALMLVIALVPGIGLAVVPVLFVAGAAAGICGPSRDVLIRKSAAGIGTGKVFGFVYSGLDLGSALGPLIIGALIDHHAPRLAFVAVAAAFALAAPAVLQVQSSAAHRRATAAAAQ